MDKWIPVSERLPYNHEYIQNNGLFNVSDGDRSYSEWFDIYDTQKFGEPTITGFRVDYAVIAWMPLPKPFKAESEEKMGISETKKQIVINNYFKNTCDVNTSIKEAFTKGFEVGLTKAVFPKDQYEARLKADMVDMLDKIRAEIEEYSLLTRERVIGIIDKYKAESEDKE